MWLLWFIAPHKRQHSRTRGRWSLDQMSQLKSSRACKMHKFYGLFHTIGQWIGALWSRIPIKHEAEVCRTSRHNKGGKKQLCHFRFAVFTLRTGNHCSSSLVVRFVFQKKDFDQICCARLSPNGVSISFINVFLFAGNYYKMKKMQCGFGLN